MKLYDVVRLTMDLPEYGLVKGQEGTILEVYDTNNFEVEFIDYNGNTLHLGTLSKDYLEKKVYHYTTSIHPIGGSYLRYHGYILWVIMTILLNSIYASNWLYNNIYLYRYRYYPWYFAIAFVISGLILAPSFHLKVAGNSQWLKATFITVFLGGFLGYYTLGMGLAHFGF